MNRKSSYSAGTCSIVYNTGVDEVVEGFVIARIPMVASTEVFVSFDFVFSHVQFGIREENSRQCNCIGVYTCLQPALF